MPEMLGEDFAKTYLRERTSNMADPKFILASGVEEISPFVEKVALSSKERTFQAL